MKLSIICCLILLSHTTWAVKVLQIGDSHTVGPFGNELYKSLTNNSNVNFTRSIGLSGSSATQWSAETQRVRTMNSGYIDRPTMNKSSIQGTVEKLSTTLDLQKPDILIVELSDNFAAYNEKEPSKFDFVVKNQVKKILDQIKEAKTKPSECFWVGPTWTDWVDENDRPLIKARDRKTNSRAHKVAHLIKQELGEKCTFIDSLKIVKKTEIKTVDGMHCDEDSGKKWGQRAYEEITRKSSLLSRKNSPQKKVESSSFQN